MRFRIFGVFGTDLEEFMYLMSDLLTPSQEGRGVGGGGGEATYLNSLVLVLIPSYTKTFVLISDYRPAAQNSTQFFSICEDSRFVTVH